MPVPRYYYSGQYGDQRERRASEFLRQRSPAGNPEAALKVFEDFHRRHQKLIHVGPEKGQRLDEVVLTNSPKNVLEIGAYLGYSAIRIARLLPDGAHLYSLENNEDNARLTEENVAHAGLGHCVTILRGTPQTNAEWLGKHPPFDLIFMDHKKLLYLEEIRRLERLGVVGIGSIVVADNIGGNFTYGYTDYVRKSGHYESRIFWGSRDGIEVSKAVRLASKKYEGGITTKMLFATIDKECLSKSRRGEGREQFNTVALKSQNAAPVRNVWVPKLHHQLVGSAEVSRQTRPAEEEVSHNGKMNAICSSSIRPSNRIARNTCQHFRRCDGCLEQACEGAAGSGRFEQKWFCNACWKAWDHRQML